MEAIAPDWHNLTALDLGHVFSAAYCGPLLILLIRHFTDGLPLFTAVGLEEMPHFSLLCS